MDERRPLRTGAGDRNRRAVGHDQGRTYRRLAVALTLLAAPVAAQEISAPSGTAFRLYDVRLETEPPLARFRFVSAAIDPTGQGKTFGDLIEDLQWVCDRVVIPSLAANDWTGDEVVLSVSSRETEFGVFDPDVTQFFQPYSIDGDTCQWEDF